MPVHDHIRRHSPECAPTPDASAPDEATAPTSASAPDAATLDAWAALGPILADHACILADRDDLLVTVNPAGTSSGAPAQFTPATATIDLDAKIFPIPPASIRPHRTGDEHRYPAAYGALTHEAAHARHSRWLPDADTPSAVAHAAELLEESRIEARHIARRPHDRVWLRACAVNLVLDEISATPPDGPYAAATAAALILGRESAGILEPAETAAVRAAAESILGADTLAELEKIWTAAHGLDDEDTSGLLDLAAKWSSLVHENADEKTKDEPHGAPSGPGTETGSESETASVPDGAGETASPIPGALAKAIAETSTAVGRAVAWEHPFPAADPAETAKDAAKQVFGKHRGTGRTRGGPVTGTRPPTSAENAAAGALARALRAAAYRERAVTTVNSELPPGRLNMRGALTRDAQKAAGALPTAKPFTRTHRHAVPTPPLRVGIAVDVSGSMSAAADPIASAAWILARATSLTDPNSASATVAFGHRATAITRPGPAPTHVTTFTAHAHTEVPAVATDALDAALGLSRPGAARLLIIATDAMFVAEEDEGLRRRLARLAASGCALLHLAFSTYGRRLPHTTLALVSDPVAAIDVINKAATAAVRAAR
ncbi:hypothetical protein KGA66_27480 [Actinocrinis puniceicyclus]|uniref:VWA domain containing CoxE-like protein n=1 Tax=Actinocrinis puniceicyclus TaxID=977794 RepID=A0A8J7WVC5_9ACTN|nr:hypothetical protein [Actinocrinis puniceicyclus]MBS2966809.1 hypothetical protein [Actinocrinis puniceicyclus]